MRLEHSKPVSIQLEISILCNGTLNLELLISIAVKFEYNDQFDYSIKFDKIFGLFLRTKGEVYDLRSVRLSCSLLGDKLELYRVYPPEMVANRERKQ